MLGLFAMIEPVLNSFNGFEVFISIRSRRNTLTGWIFLFQFIITDWL